VHRALAGPSERRAHIASFFPTNDGYEFQILYRRNRQKLESDRCKLAEDK
jgi:hypothetical protein